GTPRIRTMSRRPSPRSWVNPRAVALPAPSLAPRLAPTRPTRTWRLSRRRRSRPWASVISRKSRDESLHPEEISMIHGKVLVTGATGDTGRATVDELLARGHEVRALAHAQDDRSRTLQERGVEVVFGDLLDFDQVRAALDGAQRAYFVYPIRPGILQATAYFAQAAKEARVDGIVNMSQISARENAKSHAATDHWLSERVFDWSGLTVAHIRPTYFAEWLLYLAPMIKRGLLHVPFGTGRHAPIAAEDQGRVIAGILEDPAPHKGGMYPLFGPVEYTYEQIAQVLGRALGKSVEYKQISFDAFLEILEAGGQKP